MNMKNTKPNKPSASRSCLARLVRWGFRWSAPSGDKEASGFGVGFKRLRMSVLWLKIDDEFCYIRKHETFKGVRFRLWRLRSSIWLSPNRENTH